MMDRASTETLQQKAKQLKKAVIALCVIVAAQVVALEVVLRGWQGEDARAVFGGIGTSGLLCLLAVIIYLHARMRRSE